jgi:hypothetical protein
LAVERCGEGTASTISPLRGRCAGGMLISIQSISAKRDGCSDSATSWLAASNAWRSGAASSARINATVFRPLAPRVQVRKCLHQPLGSSLEVSRSSRRAATRARSSLTCRRLARMPHERQRTEPLGHADHHWPSASRLRPADAATGSQAFKLR